ncbi:MAG: hypothetical protein M3P08_08940 [Thermoproteota archaeon]|nr:hypothetical protein [Thermoproteota archaeon]
MRQNGFVRWLAIERNHAINTRVTMEFFKMDVKSRIPTDITEKIPARWVSAPEPLTPDRRGFDSTKLGLLYRETIPSDYHGESFDVVVKFHGDTQCYIVTGDNYQPTSTGKILANDRFRIDESKFLVKIQATSGNSSSKTTTFIITNEAQFEKFMISFYTNKNKS